MPLLGGTPVSFSSILAMASRVRSSTGCWTCRLRRKKCDETKPICNRCAKLGLTCDGYAERPFWMDGGYREKLRAEATKREIRENKGLPITESGSRTVKRRSSGPAQSKGLMETVEFASNAHGQSLSDVSTGMVSFTDATHLIEAWRMEAQPVFAHTVDQATSECGQYTDAEAGDVCTPAFDQDIMDFLGTLPVSITHTPPDVLDDFPLLQLPSNATSTVLTTADSLSQTPSATSTRGSSLKSGNSWVQPTLEEARLLMHYLDNLGQLQPPFCWAGGYEQSVIADHRAWQYVFVMRTRASYWATLNLSAHSLKANTEWPDCQDMALLELRSSLGGSISSGSSSLVNTLDCCFATMQLVYVEMLRGQSDACRAHLNTAFALMASLPNDQTMATNETSAADASALRFLSSSLRWCDAIISCSIRTAPCLALNSFEEFNDDTTWQESLSIGILNIAALDAWKKQAAETGTLGPVELVKRATAIEMRLGRVSGSFGPHVDIHVSAALVYLHVVVSGANRRVPDVYNHVDNTINLFRNMFGAENPVSADELSKFTWSLCLAGCLAEGENRAYVQALIEGSGIDRKQNECLARVVTILGECWRLSDSGEVVNPDWTSAMPSLGKELIIF